jgi:hypothetical protein
LTLTVWPAKTWLTLIFRRWWQMRPHVVMTAGPIMKGILEVI